MRNDEDLLTTGAAVDLSPDFAEPLQVVSYSIGGHYEPHVDYFNTYNSGEDQVRVLVDQDRAATFLFYLNEVEAGGATVFPLLGLAVPPRAGSALYWDNLDLGGRGYQQTLHAGCPVLAGHKVATLTVCTAVIVYISFPGHCKPLVPLLRPAKNLLSTSGVKLSLI